MGLVYLATLLPLHGNGCVSDFKIIALSRYATIICRFPLNEYNLRETASVVFWSEFLATDPVILGSISGATTFSEK
jgi:hypothetical protein